MRDINRIDGIVVKKSQALLNMEYKPSELAKELGVTAEYVRKVLIHVLGAPHTYSEKNRLWINGKRFRSWIVQYDKQFKQKKKARVVGENQFYCVKCRKLVEQDSYVLVNDGRNSMKKAYCPNCGTRINKYLKKGTVTQ